MKYYTVYMHINKINNKKYVGITCQVPQKRWRNGYGYNGTVFGSAIQEYGWDNFEHNILATDLSEQDAKNMEIELINLYSLTDLRYGYNCSKGGDLPNEETLAKAKEVNCKPIYKYTLSDGIFIEGYESASDASRQTGISRSHIAECARGNMKSAGGYFWSFEKKEKIDIPQRTRDGIAIEIYQYTSNKIFVNKYKSAYEAEKITGICQGSISHCVKGTRQTAGGFIWSSTPLN